MASERASFQQREALKVRAAATHGLGYDQAGALPDADLLLLAEMPARKESIFEDIPFAETQRRVRKVMRSSYLP